MLFSDTYKEPTTTSTANLRDRGSRFLGFAWPVKSESEIKTYLHQIKQEFPDATHHCYAWVLHPDKSAQRANDDGEPSNSAGKPILRAIVSSDLTNVLVVVVRYFGGTMLGIPGLIQAYGNCAKLTLNNLSVSEKWIEDVFNIEANFEHEQEIHRLIALFQARVLKNQYSEKVIYTVAVRRNAAQSFFSKAKDNYLLRIENATDSV